MKATFQASSAIPSSDRAQRMTGSQPSDFCSKALYIPTAAITDFHLSTAIAFNCRAFEIHGDWSWRQRQRNLSSALSVGSNCAKWFRSPTARSMRWSSEGNFRDASPSRRDASSGTSRRWRSGWLRADQPQSLARGLLTSGNGDHALFESRVGLKQRHRRRNEHRYALLARDPGVYDVRPLLHHMAALSLVLRLVVDAA